MDTVSNNAANGVLRVPPQSLEAEIAVLGGVLLENTSILKILNILKPGDFYRHGHNKIFSDMTNLFEQREPIDILTLSNLLKKSKQLDNIGGLVYLSTLVEQTPTAANIEYYAKIVKEKSVARNTIVSCLETVNELYLGQKDVSEILNSLMAKGLNAGIYEESTVHIRDSIKNEVKRIEQKFGNKSLFVGMRTGFQNIDILLGGVQTKTLMVIAGRPSTGKTALLVNLVEELSLQGGVLIFSADQTKEEFSRRILSRGSRINNIALRDGALTKKDWPLLIDTADEYSKRPIYINDSGGLFIDDVINTIHRYKHKYDIKTVMIDYVQMINRLRKETENSEVGEMANKLKNVSRELDISVIMLSQLNRELEKRDKKQPRSSDLRGSGIIEQAAHVIIMLYWNEEKERLELIVTKHKDGPTGIIYVDFDKTTYNMKDIGGSFPGR